MFMFPLESKQTWGCFSHVPPRPSQKLQVPLFQGLTALTNPIHCTDPGPTVGLCWVRDPRLLLLRDGVGVECFWVDPWDWLGHLGPCAHQGLFSLTDWSM